MVYDYLIVGGGILGLATAAALAERFPEARVLLLEKEPEPARHQTGRNSGVIHAGLYYKPGSLKARMAHAGNLSMRAYCERRGLPFEVCGKLVVATEPDELPRLEALYERALANRVPVAKLSPDEVREREPHVRALAAIHVLSTGITSYARVCRALLADIRAAGGEVRFSSEVLGTRATADGHLVRTAQGEVQTRFLVTCGGLHSDRLARTGEARIVPFRGEYYELKPERRFLVKHLIYPVANPAFPFLGVHFTRMIDGSVHAGPNAVLALKREGYGKLSFAPRDAWSTLSYPGFWRLARKHWREGGGEMLRSASKRLFTRSLQRLIPEIREDDLIPCAAGVRAQALAPDGSLVDDFLIERGPKSLHVLNAPSPAATASLEIARYILARVLDEQPAQPGTANPIPAGALA